jgi:hypothetical protein
MKPWKAKLRQFDTTAQPIAAQAPGLFSKAAYNASELPAFQSARESALGDLAGRQARGGVTGGMAERQVQSLETQMAGQRAGMQLQQAGVQSGLAGQGLEAGQASASMWGDAMRSALQSAMQKWQTGQELDAQEAAAVSQMWGAIGTGVGQTAMSFIPGVGPALAAKKAATTAAP